MSWAKITLIGFEEWLNFTNKSLFDGLVLPDGIDPDTLKSNIFMQGGAFEVLYSNPDIMRNMITSWGQKWYRTFEKWIKALNIEYEPLDNYNRHEEWDDEGTGERENKTTAESSRSIGTESEEEHADTTENTRSAFDSESYQPHDKSETSGSSSGSTDTTDSMEGSGTLEEKTGNKSSHKGHLWGNIGVTTSQQMLQSELDIAAWNIYEHITDLFIKEFCIPIYE